MFNWTRCLNQEIENIVNGTSGLILIIEELMIIGKNSKVTMSGKIIISQNSKIIGEIRDQTIEVEVGEIRVDQDANGVKDDIIYIYCIFLNELF